MAQVKPIDGLTRVETQVLAALSRAPRGLVSVRAVSRRSGVSPTSAGNAVRFLEARGLVRRRTEWIAAGRARRVELIFADVTAPDWPTLAPALGRVELPRPQRHSKRLPHIPARLRHLFWNADPSLLDLREHGVYIAERLLSTQDLDGLAWGLTVKRYAL